MLGNDVVDLEDPETLPDTFRPRFETRVFDAVERRAIAHDPNPHARRWAHWAGKEAAYKLARQIDDRFVFSPGRLVVRFEGWADDASGESVRHGHVALPDGLLPGDAGRLELRWTEHDGAVHVIARPGGSDWGAVTTSVESLAPDMDPSAAVRALARERVARDLAIDADRVRIGARGRVPTLEIDGTTGAGAISLSHHGRFVACAMAIDVEVPIEGAGASAGGSRAGAG